MKTTTFILAGALVGALTAGCIETPESDTYDPQLLAQYRAALPSHNQLEAPAPTPSALAALGDPALYPAASWDIVVGINGSVEGIITLMRNVVDTPPSVYNSVTREFFWGPYPNDDGVGYVGAYIRDAGEAADFRYHYALVRGASNDLATVTPVIWGGATPDENNQDHGVGITLWDFEANHAFEEAHNPAYESATFDRGRFIAVYGAGPDQNAPDNQMTFVVSVFRNFVPRDAEDGQPVDLDYLYGRYVTPEATVDFIDWEAPIDITEPADGIAEQVGVRMAFIDEGTGRAEAHAIGGSLEDNQSASAIECWDQGLSQTYLYFALIDGEDTISHETGDLESCGLFERSLDELNIPSLQDIDSDLMAALDQVAATGAPAL